MNITERTCSNCAAFNPSATIEEVPCWNMVSFMDGAAPTGRDPKPTDYCESHQTAEEDAAQTEAIQAARRASDATPEFLDAMGICLDVVERLGLEHPEATRALMVGMELAPASMHDFMADKAREMGLIPEADGYTDDGKPVFSLEAVAAKLGIGMEEAKELMQSMLTERDGLGLSNVLIDPATVHRKH